MEYGPYGADRHGHTVRYGVINSSHAANLDKRPTVEIRDAPKLRQKLRFGRISTIFASVRFGRSSGRSSLVAEAT